MMAAESELVGLLALAVEQDVSAKLKLTEGQVDRLYDLIDEREQAALEMSLKLRDLTPDDRRQQLRPLRIESQRRMAALLTDAQLAQLRAIGTERGDENFELGASSSDTDASEAMADSEEDATLTTEDEDTADEVVDTQSSISSAAAASAGPVDAPPATGDGKLQFSFRYQPWQDVLDWFAEQADLSLVLESPPAGTFNYTDRRRYTPAEALDVLNSILLTKGYTLVRREKMLVLVNLEDGVPPNLVTDVPLAELDDRGEYELIRVLFRVRNMTPEAASEEVSRMIGPQGDVVVLPRAGMLQVTETAGRIRAIRDVITAIERPNSSQVGAITPYDLQNAYATQVLPVLRQMLGIPTDAFSTPDGTLQLAIDNASGNRILAFGTPEMMGRLEEVIKLVDVPTAGGGMPETLQLEVYSTGQADPEGALLVLQTLLAEEPGTRLATDPNTGNLVALATPSNQSTIRATLAQMQEDVRQVEVIPLSTVDPQLALLSVTKLFGITSGEELDPRAPVVDADLSTRSLLVRGSRAQIEQIRNLLDQMGESEDSVFSGGPQGNVRLLPLTATEARGAIEQLGDIWPSLRSNPIRVVSPAAAIRSFRPGETTPESGAANDELDREEFDWDRLVPPPLPERRDNAPVDREASHPSQPVFRQAVYELTADEQSADNESRSDPPPRESVPGAPILVAPGPNGLLITSQDLDALDAYQQLLETAISQSLAGGRQYAVFYLKHAKAVAAADILSQIFGGGSGGGDGLLGGIADAALGDIGGGLMGDLLGLGGGGSTAGGFSAAAVDIVTDTRLNALIVYARPDDVDTVFRLLQVIDQRAGPTDVEADGVARLIPVKHTSATNVLEVVKGIYANRLESGPDGQPSPQDVLKALKGDQGGEALEPPKMSLGVDTRSNSLVVRAPDTLFEEVKLLVNQLDSEQLDSIQSTKVVSLKFSNSAAVKEALGSMLGDQVVTTKAAKANGQNGGEGDAAKQAAEASKQQQEFMRRIQEFRSRMQQGGGGQRGGGQRGGRPGGQRGGRR